MKSSIKVVALVIASVLFLSYAYVTWAMIGNLEAKCQRLEEHINQTDSMMLEADEALNKVIDAKEYLVNTELLLMNQTFGDKKVRDLLIKNIMEQVTEYREKRK